MLPIAALLAVGAGGPEASALVLTPLVTYSLPLVAMVAFWWEDWPGTRLRASWSGWANTALIAAGAVVLTGAGQLVTTGDVDVRALFDPSPGPGHVPTFPATLPLGGAAFVAMLELTLVGERWPLGWAPPQPAGVAALAIAWAVAVVVDLALVRHGPVDGLDFGTVLVLIGAWQVLFYVVWRGWPFSAIAARAPRLLCAHAAVVGAGVATFLVLHDGLGVRAARLGAIAGCFVAAGLVLGMLLEGWIGSRTTLLAAVLALTAGLTVALLALAGGVRFTRASADDWVEHVGLNALGVSTILHVAVGRRWPLAGLVHVVAQPGEQRVADAGLGQ